MRIIKENACEAIRKAILMDFVLNSIYYLTIYQGSNKASGLQYDDLSGLTS